MMKILIVVESGIGNCVMMTPLIKTLHLVYNKPQITLLSSKYRKEGKILEGWGYLHDCIYSANKLDRDEFDLVLISPMYGSNFNHYLVNVPPHKIIKLNLGQRIDWHNEHEVDVNMRYVRQHKGFTGTTPCTEVAIKKPNKVPKLDNNKLKIGLHAGCLNHPDYKNKLWLNKYWKQLAIKLTNKFNAQIIWFGAGKDYYDPKVGLNCVNRFDDIKETAYIIKQCNLFIGLDASLAHIANALHLPTIPIFGSTLMSKNLPYNKPVYPITTTKGSCNPCYFTPRFRKCKHNTCMTTITPSQVYNKTKKVLSEHYDKRLKVLLIASGILGNCLYNHLFKIHDMFSDIIYHNYQNKPSGFLQNANKCDLTIVLKGIGMNLNEFSKVSTRKVLWFNDNVCRYQTEFDRMKPYFDHIFTANKDNEPGTEFLPFGADTCIMDDFKYKREIDVSFPGNFHSDGRSKWIKEINKVNLKPKLKIQFFHDVKHKEYIHILNSSKIVLNQHYNSKGVNMRFYEAMITGAMLLTDRVEGILPCFKDGVHYVSYKNPADLIKKAKYYIKHDKQRELIAKAGYKEVIKNHSYIDRFYELMKWVKLR